MEATVLAGKIIVQKWAIQVRECGIWDDVDYADSLEDACLLASSLVWTVREEWIRIVTPENKIL